MADQGRVGIETPTVVRICGVPASTLDYWVLKGLVEPSVKGASGRRQTRLWSVTDVVIVRCVKALRDAGCSLQALRSVQPILKEQEGSMANTILYWDGADVVAVDQWGNLESLRRRPRQLMLHLVAIPLGDWAREAASAQSAVDLSLLPERPRREPTLRAASGS